jgi:hypothetical protein
LRIISVWPSKFVEATAASLSSIRTNFRVV